MCFARRITVELFEEHNRRGVEILKNLCKVGSQHSLKKTRVHKLLTDFAFFIGKPRYDLKQRFYRDAEYERRTREVVSRPYLNHTDRGAVSLSVDGNEIAVTMTDDALSLDETHQVRHFVQDKDGFLCC